MLSFKDAIDMDPIPGLDTGSFDLNDPRVFTPKTRNSPFSGENALKGFKSLLDVSNAMGDRRQGSYQQNPFSNLFSSSRGQGGMQLSSGPFGTTTYFPDTSSQGGGGQGGGGKEPSRMAKAISGCAAGSIFGPWGCAVGGGLGFLS